MGSPEFFGMYKKNRYRIVFSDVDGTLLNNQRELSATTTSKIRAIKQDHNVTFVMVSARMPEGMLHLYKQIGLNSPIICYNGALILKSMDDGFNHQNIIRSDFIDSKIATNLFLKAKDANLHFGIFSENEWYVNCADEWTLREENNTRVKAIVNPNIDTLINGLALKNRPIHKLMIMGNAVAIDEFINYSNHNFSKSITNYRSKDNYIEVSPINSNKAVGCEFLLNHLGLSKDNAIAFGDNHNDIEMIRAVDFGVAMENAPEIVKQAAKHIAPTNLSDGVAYTLNEIFK